MHAAFQSVCTTVNKKHREFARMSDQGAKGT